MGAALLRGDDERIADLEALAARHSSRRFRRQLGVLLPVVIAGALVFFAGTLLSLAKVLLHLSLPEPAVIQAFLEKISDGDHPALAHDLMVLPLIIAGASAALGLSPILFSVRRGQRHFLVTLPVDEVSLRERYAPDRWTGPLLFASGYGALVAFFEYSDLVRAVTDFLGVGLLVAFIRVAPVGLRAALDRVPALSGARMRRAIGGAAMLVLISGILNAAEAGRQAHGNSLQSVTRIIGAPAFALADWATSADLFARLTWLAALTVSGLLLLSSRRRWLESEFSIETLYRADAVDVSMDETLQRSRQKPVGPERWFRAALVGSTWTGSGALFDLAMRVRLRMFDSWYLLAGAVLAGILFRASGSAIYNPKFAPIAALLMATIAGSFLTMFFAAVFAMRNPFSRGGGLVTVMLTPAASWSVAASLALAPGLLSAAGGLTALLTVLAGRFEILRWDQLAFILLECALLPVKACAVVALFQTLGLRFRFELIQERQHSPPLLRLLVWALLFLVGNLFLIPEFALAMSYDREPRTYSMFGPLGVSMIWLVLATLSYLTLVRAVGRYDVSRTTR